MSMQAQSRYAHSDHRSIPVTEKCDIYTISGTNERTPLTALAQIFIFITHTGS